MADNEQLFHELLTDLRDEGDELASTVEWLSEKQMSTPTPAAGWDIRRTIGHLKWTDETALRAVTDPSGFNQWLEEMLAEATPEMIDGFVDDAAEAAAKGDTQFLLSRWTSARSRLNRALSEGDPSDRAPWFGPPMSLVSMATARLMETWAHGQDIRDALEIAPRATPRLRHIAFLGFRTRAYSYSVHGLESPTVDIRVELTLPGVAAEGEGGADGELRFGPADAEQRVTGSALDFCLLVTKRRHIADLDLEVVGEQAREWLSLAQAFAGPPGTGRQPRAERPGGSYAG